MTAPDAERSAERTGAVTRRIDVVSVAVLLVVTTAVFVPVVAWVVRQDVDHGIHRRLIEWMASGVPIGDILTRAPHFLYDLVVLLVDRLVPGVTLTKAMAAVGMAAYVASSVTIYCLLREYVGKPSTYATGFLYAVVAVAIMLVGPINLLTPDNRYLGYIVPHNYHNPTAVAAKPLTLLLFLFVVRFFDERPIRRRSPAVLAAASLTVASLLTKPNYVIAFLPALGCAAAVALLRAKPVHWKLLLSGVVLPASIVLAFQALFFREMSGVVFSPLGVFQAWSRAINPAAADALLLKFLASVLFPVLAYFADVRRATRTTYLNLAWLTFGFGALYTYLVAEPGRRMLAGNFTVSGQMTLLVLFVVSAAFVLEWLRRADLRSWSTRLRVAAIAVVFGFHVWSGIVWYRLHTGVVPMQDLMTKIW
jgi:hypothetical protein